MRVRRAIALNEVSTSPTSASPLPFVRLAQKTGKQVTNPYVYK